jgi:hypothetical protein
MERYLNKSGDSPITYYEIGDEYIRVAFKGNIKIYVYSYSRAGKAHVEYMKILAYDGKGLSAYITRYVRKEYD